MGNNPGVVGQGNLGEQIKFAAEVTTGAPVGVPAVKNATYYSAVFSTKGFNAALTNFNVGAIVAAGLFTAKLQESADGSDPTGTTGWSDVAAGGFGSPTTGAGAIGADANDVALATDLRVCAGNFARWKLTLISGTSVVVGINTVLGAASVLPASAN